MRWFWVTLIVLVGVSVAAEVADMSIVISFGAEPETTPLPPVKVEVYKGQ